MPEWGPFEALDNLSVDELRKRLQSLRAVIARAPIPIAIAHDPDCRFISSNRMGNCSAMTLSIFSRSMN